jgi:anoctamin-10
MATNRVKDWLYGITPKQPVGDKSTVVSGSFEAEDILSTHHLVNWPKSNGGAGITPQWGKWKNVQSMFPLHNEVANHTLLRRLSKRLVLTAEDLDSIRDLYGSKVGTETSSFPDHRSGI